MNNESNVKPGRSYRVAALPGDGVGSEVYAAAREVLALIRAQFHIDLLLDEQLIGGAAVDATGDPLPPATIAACRAADAILLGAVGGPKWDGNAAEQRPEKGPVAPALGVRSVLQLAAGGYPPCPAPLFPTQTGKAEGGRLADGA